VNPTDICTIYFPAGSNVTLRAVPGPDSVFGGWAWYGPEWLDAAWDSFPFSTGSPSGGKVNTQGVGVGGIGAIGKLGNLTLKMFGPREVESLFYPKGTVCELDVFPYAWDHNVNPTITGKGRVTLFPKALDCEGNTSSDCGTCYDDDGCGFLYPIGTTVRLTGFSSGAERFVQWMSNWGPLLDSCMGPAGCLIPITGYMTEYCNWPGESM
jgi:hypothetical protein